jgi:hypothetical protein
LVVDHIVTVELASLVADPDPKLGRVRVPLALERLGEDRFSGGSHGNRTNLDLVKGLENYRTVPAVETDRLVSSSCRRNSSKPSTFTLL